MVLNPYNFSHRRSRMICDHCRRSIACVSSPGGRKHDQKLNKIIRPKGKALITSEQSESAAVMSCQTRLLIAQ
jgi:hypothetical protein